MQGQCNLKKKVHVIHHYQQTTEETSRDHTTDKGKAVDKIVTTDRDQQTRNRREFPQLVKEHP